MAIVALSTQASVEARIGATRLAGFADFDGDASPDTATLSAAFLEASAIICGRLEGLYGSDEIDTWDSSTAPQLIKAISDQMCIRAFYVGNPAFQDAAQQMYDHAMDLLEKVETGVITLYDVSGTVSGVFKIERIPSDFDEGSEATLWSSRSTAEQKVKEDI